MVQEIAMTPIKAEHRRLGPTDRAFECCVCGMRCSTSSNLDQHRRSHWGKKTFACPVCGRRFKRSFNLVTHQRIHSGERPFGCTECGKHFTQSSNLGRHRRSHTREKSFTCPACGKSFSQSCYLARHQRVHTQGRSSSLPRWGKTWPDLGTPTGGQRVRRTDPDSPGVPQPRPNSVELSDFASHQQLHLNEPSGGVPHQHHPRDRRSLASPGPGDRLEWFCDPVTNGRVGCAVGGKASGSPIRVAQCDLTLVRRREAADTPQLQVTGREPFTCTSCGKMFKRLWNLVTHRQIGGEGQTFRCPVCGKGFNQSSNLARHRPTHTTGAKPAIDQLDEKPSTWPLCGENFNQSIHRCPQDGERPSTPGKGFNQLFNQDSHTGERPSTPGKGFNQLFNQDSHTEERPSTPGKGFNQLFNRDSQAGERLFTCPVCSKGFSQSCHLIRHQLLHVQDTPFKCWECSVEFAASSDLAQHQCPRRTGPNLFNCSLCRKSFTRSSYLLIHQRVHTGEKPFTCATCGRSFSQSSNLTRHQRIHVGNCRHTAPSITARLY
ncbi:zinc finger protein 420-like [Heptranchias perlo]|uniref:zinc finger protein 420-like n=1 Tax=Heptranchias perlo TaxID=212740 RepID=UPI00355980C8